MASIFSALFGTKNNTELVDAVKNGALLVDVRTPAEFSAGSVKGAINIPMERIQNQMKKFRGKKAVVLFCRSGARSGYAKGILERNGIENVFNGGSVGNMNQILIKNV